MPGQYVVPQFTDQESAVLGPLVVRQFVILVIAGFVEYGMYQVLSPLAFWILTIPIGGGSLAMAFLKINGFPMHIFLLNLAIFYRRPQFRVWFQEENKIDASKISAIKKGAQEEEKELSRLSELSLVVDTGGVFEGFDEEKERKQIVSGME